MSDVQSGKPLLIIAEDVEGEALDTDLSRTSRHGSRNEQFPPCA